jgi:putative ABC transport system ATP-binding protein
MMALLIRSYLPNANNISMKTIVETSDLIKVYMMGDIKVHALKSVSLSIEEGEFLAIMGASGSGKSTLMNILGCLDVPSKGVYLLDGVNISTLSKDELARLRNQKIGFVFQTFNLLSRTSALENVELPLLYNPYVKPRNRKALAEEALIRVGLKDRMHHFPNQLSGGQQQRVAIARALINKPVIIFADEPTGNLDTRTSIEVMNIFQELNQGGNTIVMVTHEDDIALHAKREIRLKDGKIIKDQILTERKIASEAMAEFLTLSDEEESLNGF